VDRFRASTSVGLRGLRMPSRARRRAGLALRRLRRGSDGRKGALVARRM